MPYATVGKKTPTDIELYTKIMARVTLWCLSTDIH